MDPAGFLNVLKPPGMTSHDVVAFVRRRLGGGKVGHLGTLDPPAAGVLPLAVGRATRTLEFLPPARKAYRAEVTFGVETDTLDAAGEVLARHPVEGVTRARVEEACARFQGTLMQVPPRVSALRQGGRRSYDRARQGEEFELPPREAVYHAVRVVDCRDGTALLDVDCGPGTYVRALARDLGHALGCGAILSFLLRTRSGPFHLDDAVLLEDLLAGLAERVTPVGETFARAGVPAVEVEAGPVGSEVAARPLDGAPEGVVRLVAPGGAALGLGRVSSKSPLRVRIERSLPEGGSS